MCPAWGCLRLGKRGWEEALVNLLNISLRGSFPPPPPFTHHTASALAGWSLRVTDRISLAIMVLLVLVPFSCGRGKVLAISLLGSFLYF